MQTYGYSRAEFLALTILDMRPPEEHEALRARLADIHARPVQRHERASRHRTRDGRVLDVVVTSSALHFGGGAGPDGAGPGHHRAPAAGGRAGAAAARGRGRGRTGTR